MIRTYPQETKNPNVPKDVFLIAECIYMSGEIKKTFYVDKKGYMFFVGDWVMDKPQTASIGQVCKLTLDTEQMINARFDNWKRRIS